MNKIKFTNLRAPFEIAHEPRQWKLSHVSISNPSSTGLWFHIYANMTGSSVVTGSTATHSSFFIPGTTTGAIPFGDSVFQYISIHSSQNADGTGELASGSYGAFYLE